MRRRSGFLLFDQITVGNLKSANSGREEGASYVKGYGYMKVIICSFKTRTSDPAVENVAPQIAETRG